jgi:hypothetical protein
MNFRPTKWKVILSIAIPVILWVLAIITLKIMIDRSSDNLPSYLGDLKLAPIMNLNDISIPIIGIIIIYLIWSIVQKKGIKINKITAKKKRKK